MDNKKQISFEGRGTVAIEYHKYTAEKGQKIVSAVEEAVGKVVFDVRSFLLERGWINANGDLLKKPPKRVTITDGDAFFSDADIQGADLLELNGGQLGADLKAKSIMIRGGNHANFTIIGDDIIIQKPFSSGDVCAQTLTVFDTEITSPLKVSGDASFHSSSNKNTLYVGGQLSNFGTTVINDGANVGRMINQSSTKILGGRVSGNMTNCDATEVHRVDVGGSMTNDGDAKIYGGIVQGAMINHRHAKIYDGVVRGDMINKGETEVHNVKVAGVMNNQDAAIIYCANAKNLLFHDRVQILGPVKGVIERIQDGVIIGPKATFDEVARQSLQALPPSQKLISLGLQTPASGDRMRV